MFLEENIVFVVAVVFILGIACFWSAMCYIIAAAYYRRRHSQNINTFDEDGKESTFNNCNNGLVSESLDYPQNRSNEGQRVNRLNSI